MIPFIEYSIFGNDEANKAKNEKENGTVSYFT
jgi:hypothetical protein